MERAQAIMVLAQHLSRLAAGEEVDVVVGSLRDALSAAAPSATVRPLFPDLERPARDVPMELFRYWQRRCGHTQARPTAERLRAVRARMAEGYSETDVRRAIDGCASSAWHRGENEQGRRFDDLTLICRSGSRLEQFAGMASDDEIAMLAVDAASDEATDSRDVKALKQQAAAAMKAGKAEEYEMINARLRAALKGSR